MALNPQGDVPISDQGSVLVLVPASARDGLSMGGAAVLHGRTHRDLTAPRAAVQLKEHFKQIPPGQFPLPPSSPSGECTGMCLSLSLALRKSKPSTVPPNTIFHTSSYPPSFGGFQAFLEEVPSPAAFITGASPEMYNPYSSPSTLNTAGLQEEP